jgi:heme-degrading monooxygenase HmoA
MVKTIEMDEKISLTNQLQQDVRGGVVLIITFTVNPEDEDQFIKTWASAAEISKKTSGIMATQLYRGIAGSRIFVSTHVFESTEAIKQQYKNAQFPSKLAEYPTNIVTSTNVLKKVAVPGICVD